VKDFQRAVIFADIVEIDGNLYHRVVFTVFMPSSCASFHAVGYSEKYIYAPIANGKLKIIFDDPQEFDIQPGPKNGFELTEHARFGVEKLYDVNCSPRLKIGLFYIIIDFAGRCPKFLRSEGFEEIGVDFAESSLLQGMGERSLFSR